MSQESRFIPEPYLVISDFGQVQAFVDPWKIQVLRILQRQEATVTQLVSLTGASESTVTESIGALSALKLIRVVGQLGEDGAIEDVYRATARIYDLQPEPGDNPLVMAPVAGATLDSVRQEVVTSLTDWPDQRMNYESRRRRMTQDRAMEFNDRLIELLTEFWGDPDHPAEEDTDAPVMAFAGIWYRFPDKT